MSSPYTHTKEGKLIKTTLFVCVSLVAERLRARQYSCSVGLAVS